LLHPLIVDENCSTDPPRRRHLFGGGDGEDGDVQSVRTSTWRSGWRTCALSSRTASKGALDGSRSWIAWVTTALAMRTASWMSVPLASSAVIAAAKVHPAPLGRSVPTLGVEYAGVVSPLKSARARVAPVCSRPSG